ncbi:hypothetical protein XFF6166_150027 [Xanthomonas citri pv. fuscans]|nr:hypothetical protein XFF6166_150027 [Xanthomonas citri pv. fuscans]
MWDTFAESRKRSFVGLANYRL